jgi:predicted dehydrogenase
MTRARTIILGASHWHVPLYLDAMREHHEVIGVSDDAPESARTAAEHFGLEPAADHTALMDLPGVELAYVFLPHEHMAAACLALVERGIPFVVEKPAGISLAQLAEVRDAARAAGVPATVPLMQRDAPIERWLRQATDPVYARYSFIAGPPARYLRNGSPWMLDPARAGGGCLANLGPHFVDLFLRAIGTTDVRVRATGGSALHHGEVEDHAVLVLTAADGREGVLEIGYAFPDSPLKRSSGYTVAGRGGFAEIAGDGRAAFTSTAGDTVTTEFDVDSDPLYGPFVASVARTLPDGFAGLATLDELHEVMAVIWEAYRQIREEERA